MTNPHGKMRSKLGPSSRKSKPAVHATISKELKSRLVTASIMEGKNEADIVRAAVEVALEELEY